MNILALDLATKTGWAMTVNRKIASGTVNFVNKHWDGSGMRFLKFQTWLTKFKDLDLVVYEAVEKHLADATYSQHVYGGFFTHLQSYCEKHKIPYTGLGVTTIKKFWTGKGNANKDAMMKVAWDKGFNPKDDNEADALAILHMAMETYS